MFLVVEILGNNIFEKDKEIDNISVSKPRGDQSDFDDNAVS